MADKELLHKSLTENLSFSFARSGGKGGQNVNKVNTKVHASLPLSALLGLNETELNLLRIRLNSNINNQNEIFIDVDDERYQEKNRQIAIERLEGKILNAVKIQKKRKKTKPTKASKERRLLGKKIRSQIKAARREKY